MVLAENGLGIHESDRLSFDECQTNRSARLKMGDLLVTVAEARCPESIRV